MFWKIISVLKGAGDWSKYLYSLNHENGEHSIFNSRLSILLRDNDQYITNIIDIINRFSSEEYYLLLRFILS